MRKPSPTIGARLVALVLAIVLPTCAISVVGAVALWRSAQRATEQELQQRAQALSSVIELQLETAKASLNMLAVSPSVQSGDLEAFRRRLVGAPHAEGTRFILSGPDGRMLVTSKDPPGSVLPIRRNGEIARRIFATGQPQVSNLYIGASSHQPVIAVDVPVFVGGVVTYDLALAMPPALFGRLLEQQLPPGVDWISGIVDGDNVVVARAPDMASYVGRTGTATAARIVASPAQNGVFASMALDGRWTMSAFQRVPGSAWVAFVSLHWSAVSTKLWQSLLIVAIGGVLLLLLGLCAALYQARRIAKSIGGLVAEPPITVANGLQEVEAVARTLAEAAAQRARSAAALRESEARFRAITDTMPQIVWTARPDGHHDYFNRRWYELTGSRPDEHEGDVWHALIHPDDQERTWRHWQRSLTTGEPFEAEHRLRLPDGTTRWLLTRAVAVRDPASGAVTRWLGTGTDIEDAVAAREALARSREQLEHLVEARTRDLQETQSRLAQARRMEALGQLAGGIAHDFNNVLQAVHGGTTLIARRPDDPERVRRLALMVLQATERGAAVTSRLLTFSHRGDLRAEPVDAERLLEGLSEILAHTLGDGITVRIDVARSLPPLLADKGQLETVLVNLATNARDAMTGTGTLTLSAAEQIVGGDDPGREPPGLDEGRYVRLCVADTGAGMDAATLARASEPFFTTKPVGKGTGLGLAMARGFVEQSGGGLHIASRPGQGTRVSLWFPAAIRPNAAAGAPDPAATAAAERPGLRGRVALVDDDATVRVLLAEQMEDLGFDVVTADSAAAALMLIEADATINLVVSDLSMPGMDGMALIQEIRRRRPGLPAILLTGFVSDAAEIAVAGAVSGSFSLLRKPVDGRALAERIATLLDGKPAPALASAASD